MRAQKISCLWFCLAVTCSGALTSLGGVIAGPTAFLQHPPAIDGYDYMLHDPGIPPLLRALSTQDLPKARSLIAAGADVNASDQYGITPLMIAVADTTGAVQQLLTAGARVNAKDKIEGQTALFIAVRKGDLSMCEVLVHHGADVNTKSKYGETPLIEAAAFCHTPVARFLVQSGADINASTQVGATPLILAASLDCPTVVEVLIKAGAHLNARNLEGKTALSVSKESGYSRIVQMLKGAGARQ